MRREACVSHPILRFPPESAKIFYDASEEDAEYIFGDHVAEILQVEGKKVRVTLDQGGEK